MYIEYIVQHYGAMPAISNETHCIALLLGFPEARSRTVPLLHVQKKGSGVPYETNRI